MSHSTHFSDIVSRRMSRRRFLSGASAAAMVIYLPSLNLPLGRPPRSRKGLNFTPIPSSVADEVLVADGHRVDRLLSWGDPVLPGAPPFDPEHLTVEAQSGQFGYNCDFVGFMPLPRGSDRSNHGLLVVNHEYTNPELMFPNFSLDGLDRHQMEVQLAAHGLSIVEVRWSPTSGWSVVPDSHYARRITGTEPTLVTGPAAGHHLLQTQADPSGTRVIGTLANCSAGRTPWGTVLSGEENFHGYFGNRDDVTDDGLRVIHARYGAPRDVSSFGFEQVDHRFDLGREPKEPFRFGWVVEVDPYDPTWVPRKRTALGRIRREGATSVVARNGRLVLYSGDDIPFEYIYKFVTEEAYDPNSRAANRDLLDRGTLFVARFDHDGTGVWIALVQGDGPLIPENGFADQGDVVAKAVLAGDLVSATKMDRPEDIAVSPESGHVYVSLTNNELRGTAGFLGRDASNPRMRNRHGHIVEIRERDADHAGARFEWDIFMLCGDPANGDTYFAGYPKSRVSAVSCPDNLAFDGDGHLWVATDGQPRTMLANDGLYAVPVTGPERGRIRRFLTAVPGAEVCGPEFTPDDGSMFVSIQHPGEGSTLAAPTSRWPEGTLPRPSVVVVQSTEGHKVGSIPDFPYNRDNEDTELK